MHRVGLVNSWKTGKIPKKTSKELSFETEGAQLQNNLAIDAFMVFSENFKKTSLEQKEIFMATSSRRTPSFQLLASCLKIYGKIENTENHARKWVMSEFCI